MFLPGQRSLAGYSPWVTKESDMTEPPLKAQPTPLAPRAAPACPALLTLARSASVLVWSFSFPCSIFTLRSLGDRWAGGVVQRLQWGQGSSMQLTPPRVTLWGVQLGDEGQAGGPLAAHPLLACRGQQGLEDGSAHMHQPPGKRLTSALWWDPAEQRETTRQF